MDRNVGPVLVQDALAERVAFNKLNGLETADPSSGKAESTDA